MAGYRKAVEWIAVEDEPDDLDVDVVSGYLTVHMVADLFGKDTVTVARAVVRKRKQLIKEGVL